MLYEKGWIDYDADLHDEMQWNLWWKTSRFRSSDYYDLFPWQRLNHCPKATGIALGPALVEQWFAGLLSSAHQHLADVELRIESISQESPGRIVWPDS